MKTEITKTTNWLTRRYTEEELDKMKEEAIKEAEVELQRKQIEEMAKVIARFRGYGCTEHPCDMSCTLYAGGCIPYEEAEVLYNADYRKIINCKDCENCREYTKWNGRNYLGCTRLAELCDGQIVEVSENDFCSFAKMKGGAE